MVRMKHRGDVCPYPKKRKACTERKCHCLCRCHILSKREVWRYRCAVKQEDPMITRDEFEVLARRLHEETAIHSNLSFISRHHCAR